VGLQAKDFISRAIDEADVVLTLGYDMVEYHPRLWNDRADKRIIHVDFLPSEIDDHYYPEVEVVGDIAHTLWMLNERFAKDGVPDYDLSGQRSARADMKAELEEHKDDDTDGSIRPQKVLWDARQVLGPDDVLLSDVGAHKMWIARHYHCHEPNTCLIPNGFCSMGFALPGALAAALVHPDKRILGICGDAGFLMNVQEMETAKRLNLNLTVMVWEDKGYGLIKWKQENHFGRHTDLDFGNPDWMQLASAFGWNGFHVTRSADLQSELAKSFETPGPSLVVVPIDYRENRLLTQRLGNIAVAI
jgi:acetolactate synthase-1/2/3 large subunit